GQGHVNGLQRATEPTAILPDGPHVVGSARGGLEEVRPEVSAILVNVMRVEGFPGKLERHLRMTQERECVLALVFVLPEYVLLGPFGARFRPPAVLSAVEAAGGAGVA